MQALRSFNQLSETTRFLATAMVLYVLWFLLYDQWLFPDGRLDTWLSVQEAALSGFLLNILGFGGSAAGPIVKMNGYDVVLIGNPCNGMVLFGLFAGFILAFPGSWKNKLLFIPFGLLAIYFLNVLRIMALALNSFYSRHTLEFNHKYTFAFVVYGFIFASWMLWIKRYAKPRQNPNPA